MHSGRIYYSVASFTIQLPLCESFSGRLPLFLAISAIFGRLPMSSTLRHASDALDLEVLSHLSNSFVQPAKELKNIPTWVTDFARLDFMWLASAPTRPSTFARRETNNLKSDSPTTDAYCTSKVSRSMKLMRFHVFSKRKIGSLLVFAPASEGDDYTEFFDQPMLKRTPHRVGTCRN